MIQPGIYYDLSSDDYHNDRDSISRTSLMEFKKNNRKYWSRYIDPNRPPPETKASWEFGTAFHTLILEPHLFEKNYFLMPEKVLLKDVGRKVYDNYKAIERQAESLQNQVVLSWNDSRLLFAMRDALYRNPRAKELIEGAIYESSYFWEDEHSQIMLKCRPDIIQGNIYIDLKTIDDASPENFQREMAKYGYNLQGSMTRDGILATKGERIEAVVNICVEKQHPHLIGTYIIDESALDVGHTQYKQALLDLKECRALDTWPDYSIQTIGLPAWAI